MDWLDDSPSDCRLRFLIHASALDGRWFSIDICLTGDRNRASFCKTGDNHMGNQQRYDRFQLVLYTDDIYLSANYFAKLSTNSFHDMNAIGQSLIGMLQGMFSLQLFPACISYLRHFDAPL